MRTKNFVDKYTSKRETILTASVITSGRTGKYFLQQTDLKSMLPRHFICVKNLLFPLQTDIKVFLNDTSRHMLHTGTMRTSLAVEHEITKRVA